MAVLYCVGLHHADKARTQTPALYRQGDTDRMTGRLAKELNYTTRAQLAHAAGQAPPGLPAVMAATKEESATENPFGRRRDLEKQYEIWTAKDGEYEWRVLKKYKADDAAPGAFGTARSGRWTPTACGSSGT